MSGQRKEGIKEEENKKREEGKRGNGKEPQNEISRKERFGKSKSRLR